MWIDYLVEALQIIAFELVGFGCVLCLWEAVHNAQEASVEHARGLEGADWGSLQHRPHEQGSPAVSSPLIAPVNSSHRAVDPGVCTSQLLARDLNPE